jgi:hypothetical protein
MQDVGYTLNYLASTFESAADKAEIARLQVRTVGLTSCMSQV